MALKGRKKKKKKLKLIAAAMLSKSNNAIWSMVNPRQSILATYRVNKIEGL
jgi:hypothetical protein